MRIDLRDARYALAVVEMIVTERLPHEARTNECPECAEVQGHLENDDHLVWSSSKGDEVVVIIGCEGYWVVDPSLVGINSPNWQAADAGFAAEVDEDFS